jgi:DNA-binding beta-propeller fold protein YncE
MKVLNSSNGEPIGSLPVQAEALQPACSSGPSVKEDLGTIDTNASGFLSLGGPYDWSYLAVSVGLRSYSVNASISAGALTCVTLGLPSGDLNITQACNLADYFGHQTSTSTQSTSGTEPSISSALAANITVSGFPGEVAVNPNTNRIYLSDVFANELTVLDASTHSVLGTITLPGTAQSGIAVDTTSNTVYVPVAGCTNELNASNSCYSGPSREGQGGIVAINGTTDSVIGEYHFNVGALAVDPSTGVLYGISENVGLSSPSSGFLLEINEASGSLIANISLGAGPLNLAVNAKTNTVYVTACKGISLSCLGAEVLVVNGASHSLQSATSLDFNALNFNLVVDASTNTVYTMGEDGPNLMLVALDGSSGKVDYLQAVGSSCAGAGGGTLAINTASGLIYAAFDSQLFFLVISASTGQTVNMLSTSAWFQAAAFNSVTSQVYMTSEAQNQKVGYLLIVPGVFNETFVNISLLQLGICVP